MSMVLLLMLTHYGYANQLCEVYVV